MMATEIPAAIQTIVFTTAMMATEIPAAIQTIAIVRRGSL